VTIKAHSSPLGQLQRLARPYGYCISDTPAGPVLLHRVSGYPTEEPTVVFAEGTHLMDTRRTYRTSEIVNVWDMHGVTYEDEYGGRVPIRSIADPAEVEAHPEVIGGYSYKQESNSDIVRQDQADAIRNVAEIDHGDATATLRWEGVAVPFLSIGDCVEVASETVEAEGRFWLENIDGDESIASYQGWRGTGEGLPGIVNRETITIQAAVWHGGDEYVSHYAHPAAQGTEEDWAFSLPERVSVANVRGWCHSWNSQTVAGEDTELTVSRWEVWLAGVDRDNEDNQPESSGTMPHMPEQYNARPNFATFSVNSALAVGDPERVTNPGKWVPFAVNLRTLDAGDYVLVFKCGEKAGFDDGEVREVYLETFGTIEAAGAVEDE
jgi:hypothetical protein